MIRLIAFILALALALPALAQNRHALVIGIDDYAHVAPLQKARNDARAVAAALEPAGFRVTALLDPDRRAMTQALGRFAAGLAQGDEALFYFAGHGIEVDGQNYLLPADIPEARPGDEDFLIAEAIGVDHVLASLQRRGVRVSLLILDACRDNPFPRQGTRSLGTTRGLGRVTAPEGSFVLFSAGAGQAALDRLGDDDADPNSVFTRALLPRLTQPGLDLRSMVQQVRSDVRRTAMSVGHDQFPAVYDQLDGDFRFVPAAMIEAEPAPITGTADPCASALPVWSAIQNSDSTAALEGFAETYATTCPALAALAQDRLASAPSNQALQQLSEVITRQYDDGSVYEGTFLNGLQHGRGTYRLPNGFEYTGEFLHGAITGQGRARYPNGSTYEGEFFDGSPHGRGRMIFADGSSFEGDWISGAITGEGTRVFVTGVIYTGQFRNSQPHGRGVMERPGGMRYEGEWVDGQRHGQGVITYPDGSVYEGEMRNDQRHGEGRLTMSDGAVYEGEFVDDLRQGRGRLTAADGQVVIGTWIEDRIAGDPVRGLAPSRAAP